MGNDTSLLALLDRQGQRAPDATGHEKQGEALRVVVCAPPQDSRLFVSLLPPGNERGIEVITFTDDCSTLEQDVAETRATVVLLSPMARNYSAQLVDRLRRWPDFLVVVVGLVPPTGDWGTEMTAAGASAFLTTPVDSSTVDRFVAMLPALVRRAAEERASPGFVIGLDQKTKAAIAAQGYRQGIYVSWSPKGGAGKTTVATNIAALLGAVCERPTLLIDANMNGGHVWLHTGISVVNTIYGLACDFKSNGNRLEPRDLAQRVVHYNRALDVLIGIVRVEQAASDELRGKQGMAFMEALLDLARRQYDFVVIDLGSSPNNPIHLVALQKADGVLLVVTPDRTAIGDARTTMETLEQAVGLRRDTFRLVLNMFTDEAGLDRGEIARWLSLVEMGLIPLDREGRLVHCVNVGTPFVLKYLGSSDPEENAILDGFAGVARQIYPPLAAVWESRRKRLRRPAGRGLLGKFQQALGLPA